MNDVEAVTAAVTALKDSLRGPLLEPGHSDFEQARQLYNAMIDKYPGMIAQCASVADVIHAVRIAHQSGLSVAVRGGGHNGAGFGSCDDGLVIDLGPMRGIRVDPEAQIIHAEGDCTQGDIDHAGHPFGLTVPAGIISTTGIGGLTLGGGHGYLSRRFGLTIDNLIEADVVLADGRFVTASEKRHPDLFWALKGGGGNFGVVTRFAYRAREVQSVVGGPMFWALEDAPKIMAWYRQFIQDAPLTVSAFLGIKKVPATEPFPKERWGQTVCALVWCHCGPEEEADRIMRPVREIAEPVLDWVGPMPFPALQGLFDPLHPPGLQWYWKGAFIRELSEAAIDVHMQFAEQLPSDLSLMHLYPINGAVHQVGSTDTAWPWRDVTWSMVIAGIDPNPSNADRIRQWARDYWQAIHPHSAGATYVNFMMEEGNDRIRATYGPNHSRLAAIKKKYDPDNFFRLNQNVQPAA